MKNFVFYNPTKIIFGENTISKIGEEIKKFGLNKILLHYGSGSIKRNGVYDQVINSLKEYNIEWIEVSGVKPNPRLSKVYEGIKFAKEHNVDGILAVGGGSVIDSAKAIAGGFYYDGDIWDAYSKKYIIKKALPLFSVLTLSATGSEMNGNSVITKEETKQKWATHSKELYPKVSIIDPTAQYSLPEKQTINGAVDAISHVMEYYFDGTSGTEIQHQIAEGIIRTVIKNTEILLENPKDYNARSNLAWSATLALNGLLNAGSSGGDWASHALEHSVSAIFDIAHGEGLAIIFPAWLEYVKNDNLEIFDRFANEIFNIDTGNAAIDANLGIQALKEWYKKIGQPISLKEIGAKEEDIETLVKNAVQMAPMGKLKKLEEKDIREIYTIAFKNK
ncbi:iron-containing alcohol dehydrogenase [Marinitoga sp. 1155]|uniref:iron-containing alcohol dehydrogenase n=1 Tax=Marinitoga sp. 1155 TaxID=1428448 RepID=UPI000640E41C|nr:iron-containing alcohol dehydrogenase [Marinitoga sp. 1155]KLO24585.1 NADH-dependent butanol dehydrogenase [Marinitoga sp. 1155]